MLWGHVLYAGTSDFAGFTVRAPHALHTLHTCASVHVTGISFEYRVFMYAFDFSILQGWMGPPRKSDSSGSDSAFCTLAGAASRPHISPQISCFLEKPRRHPWSSMGWWRKREIGRHLGAGWGATSLVICDADFSIFRVLKVELAFFFLAKKWNTTCMTALEKIREQLLHAFISIHWSSNRTFHFTTLVEKS